MYTYCITPDKMNNMIRNQRRYEDSDDENTPGVSYRLLSNRYNNTQYNNNIEENLYDRHGYSNIKKNSTMNDNKNVETSTNIQQQQQQQCNNTNTIDILDMLYDLSGEFQSNIDIDQKLLTDDINIQKQNIINSYTLLYIKNISKVCLRYKSLFTDRITQMTSGLQENNTININRDINENQTRRIRYKSSCILSSLDYISILSPKYQQSLKNAMNNLHLSSLPLVPLEVILDSRRVGNISRINMQSLLPLISTDIDTSINNDWSYYIHSMSSNILRSKLYEQELNTTDDINSNNTNLKKTKISNIPFLQMDDPVIDISIQLNRIIDDLPSTSPVSMFWKEYKLYIKQVTIENSIQFLRTYNSADWFKNLYGTINTNITINDILNIPIDNNKNLKETPPTIIIRSNNWIEKRNIWCNTLQSIIDTNKINIIEALKDKNSIQYLSTQLNIKLQIFDQSIRYWIRLINIPSLGISDDIMKENFKKILNGIKVLLFGPISMLKSFTREIQIGFSTENDLLNTLSWVDKYKDTWPKELCKLPYEGAHIQIIDVYYINDNNTIYIPPSTTVPLAPQYTSTDIQCIYDDILSALTLCESFDKIRCLTNLSSNYLPNKQNIRNSQKNITSINVYISLLNIILEYLKTVHLYCYYTATQFTTLEELIVVCGTRPPRVMDIVSIKQLDILKKQIQKDKLSISSIKYFNIRNRLFNSQIKDLAENIYIYTYINMLSTTKQTTDDIYINKLNLAYKRITSLSSICTGQVDFQNANDYSIIRRYTALLLENNLEMRANNRVRCILCRKVFETLINAVMHILNQQIHKNIVDEIQKDVQRSYFQIRLTLDPQITLPYSIPQLSNNINNDNLVLRKNIIRFWELINEGTKVTVQLDSKKKLQKSNSNDDTNTKEQKIKPKKIHVSTDPIAQIDILKPNTASSTDTDISTHTLTYKKVQYRFLEQIPHTLSVEYPIYKLDL